MDEDSFAGKTREINAPEITITTICRRRVGLILPAKKERQNRHVPVTSTVMIKRWLSVMGDPGDWFISRMMPAVTPMVATKNRKLLREGPLSALSNASKDDTCGSVDADAAFLYRSAVARGRIEVAIHMAVSTKEAVMTRHTREPATNAKAVQVKVVCGEISLMMSARHAMKTPVPIPRSAVPERYAKSQAMPTCATRSAINAMPQDESANATMESFLKLIEIPILSRRQKRRRDRALHVTAINQVKSFLKSRLAVGLLIAKEPLQKIT